MVFVRTCKPSHVLLHLARALPPLEHGSHAYPSPTCTRLSNATWYLSSHSSKTMRPEASQNATTRLPYESGGLKTLSMAWVASARNVYEVCFFIALPFKSAYSTAKALDSVSPNNWLDDNIWLKKAYHEWRAPLIVNSNWWLSFKNDTTVPLEVVLGTARDGDVGGTGITRWQIRRAAWLTYRLLDFNAQLQRCVYSTFPTCM